MASRFFARSFKSINSLKSFQSNKCSLLQTTAKLNSAFAPLTKINSRPFSATIINFQESNFLKSLNSFLAEEIKLEAQTKKALPKIEGFETKTEGPNVTLTKTHSNETIKVTFNINGSLDSSENVDETIESQKPDQEPETPQMRSKPHFTVEIKKGTQVLSFGCSYLPREPDQTAEDFQIDELAIHEGEWNENVYTADCSVLDGNLYDILLNILDERGIGESFANQLAEFSSAYEHHQYIGLLEKLKNFSK